ncbi:hypothetical protein VDG1235_3687 [Verrucomicrobiia bacterium DG1235]|nr:hypothetical protein VDG1235_3687 [Verrucomicrobiae bacterium DG1235]
MKSILRILALFLSLCLLAGCAATVPIKVAATATKAGVKTAKAGVKTTAKVGAAIIPNNSDEESD